MDRRFWPSHSQAPRSQTQASGTTCLVPSRNKLLVHGMVAKRTFRLGDNASQHARLRNRVEAAMKKPSPCLHSFGIISRHQRKMKTAKSSAHNQSMVSEVRKARPLDFNTSSRAWIC